MNNMDWFESKLRAPREDHDKAYAFAREEIRKAWRNDENVWFKLNQLRQHLTLNKLEWDILVDFCHTLLED